MRIYIDADACPVTRAAEDDRRFGESFARLAEEARREKEGGAEP